MKQINDASFEKTVQSDKPVLVKFWAEWCGPCKMLQPTLDKVSQQFSDRVDVVGLDADTYREAPQKYRVRGLPTLMLFKQGKLVATKVGNLSESSLTEFLNRSL